MKLATFETGGRERIGIVVDDGLIDLSRAAPDLPSDMKALIATWADVAGRVQQIARDTKPELKVADVRLCAPVPRPQKILAIGLNYDDHITETGREAPKEQTWFSKMPSAVNGPYDPIQIPRASSAVDYEAELVFIVSRRCRHVSREDAASVVFGYCVGNDVSVRDWQFATTQFVLGKSFDTHAPFGPWIVTADEVGDPHDLGIRCFVNGEKRQESNTRHLIFNVFDQIAHLTKALTLEPGDVVYTGTPSGVGFAMKPPKFLQAGDVVRVEIDPLGAIEARMEAEA
ncbi:MAG TPA: fumarylacetoacetate hydrolase family protein [Rhizomicrobium sp.]|jgi:2-keto-4-pentenoate hydratase/2-oxohepta-3-ene-1,7-dioic acid hydratase in catechol pathway